MSFNSLYGNFFRKTMILIITVVLSSCSEDIIDIDLASFEKSIVIEGIISNQQGPYTVRISRIDNYFSDDISHTVSDATVIISDNEGNSESLTETEPGNYVTSSFRGVPGRTYLLTVISEGKEYRASSKMPLPIEFSSINSEYVIQNNYNLLLYIKDRKEIEEFGRIKIFKNGGYKNEKMFQDQYSEGDVVLIKEKNFSRFDQVTIELITLEKNIYRYFEDLKDIEENKNSDAIEIIKLASGNPKSNITNNALGYFSAQTYKQYSYVIK
ncbi:MAG: hypothetical protein CVV23_15980 [Ignavibacteriae bacterium HGW-Ignavibacteriae-2]|nr:MAG: hypothetical protein CVV23_15980 [Ignavibacteriae bacterium HGW-Ignavibacteriae-2]